MSRKRTAAADWDLPTSSPSTPKRPRVTPKPTACLPRKRYPKHAASKVGEDFHSVPYPLTLLPKPSWQALNQGEPSAICSSCGKARLASAHQRKLFLVAERLSWDLSISVSFAARSQNEEALWAVNAELGIYEPAMVGDEEVVVGGRRGREEKWFPYKYEEEVEFAMRLIATAEVLSEASWTMWKGMVGRMLKMMRVEEHHLEQPPDFVHASTRRSPRKKGKQVVEPLPTPPSSNWEEGTGIAKEEPLVCSYDTLQDFYSLLDKIERTSPMGARFLEAYADRLHNEKCEGCWFSSIPIVEDEPEPPLSKASPLSSRSYPLDHGRAPAHERYAAMPSPARPAVPSSISARLRDIRLPARSARQSAWVGDDFPAGL